MDLERYIAGKLDFPDHYCNGGGYFTRDRLRMVLSEIVEELIIDALDYENQNTESLYNNYLYDGDETYAEYVCSRFITSLKLKRPDQQQS